jgi:hypothetical protein
MKRVIAGLFVLFLSGSVFGEMVVLEKWRVAERSSISVNVFKSSSDHIGFRLVLGALGNKSWRFICSNSWVDDLAEDLMLNNS